MLGPVMLDLAGTALQPEERRLLGHPAVGGVILFTRNFISAEQLRALTDEIHSVRRPPLLIAADHEGGRVQRFREGFTHLPAASAIGALYDQNRNAGLSLAREVGYLKACELGRAGIDLSFSPVLDLAVGVSEVIEGRAFHRTADGVGALATATMTGMNAGGMQAVGKHYPGHGHVAADSHHTLPVDRRLKEDLADDLAPFERLIRAGMPALMTAHVLYPDVDEVPATFSRRWLAQTLRGHTGFEGAVFSDDLSMGGAAAMGSPADRARRAIEAGCDMVLVCNDPEAARQVCHAVAGLVDPVSGVRLARLHGRPRPAHDGPDADERWARAQRHVRRVVEAADFSLE